MKIDAKLDPKSDLEIDVWTSEGSIFEVLGGLLRSQIFNEFLIGKKFAKNLQFWASGSAKGGQPGILREGRRIGRGRSEAQEPCSFLSFI